MPPVQPLSSPVQAEDREPLSPAVGWIGGSIYVLLVLIGFCFGVWAGNEKPKPVEVVNAAPAPVPAPAPAPQPQPAPQPPPEPMPAPPEPMPMPTITPTPKPPMPKPPEPKPPEPKPSPKIRQVSFEKEVLPVFRAKCLNCHGAVGKPKGDLDLRTLASIAKGGNAGDALVPGDLKKSAIWVLIEDGSMPEPGSPPLTLEEIDLIRNWVLSGGK